MEPVSMKLIIDTIFVITVIGMASIAGIAYYGDPDNPYHIWSFKMLTGLTGFFWGLGLILYFVTLS